VQRIQPVERLFGERSFLDSLLNMVAGLQEDRVWTVMVQKTLEGFKSCFFVDLIDFDVVALNHKSQGHGKFSTRENKVGL
jgi:hypothetical protein